MMAANKREEEAEKREIRTHSMRDDAENNLADSTDQKRPAPYDRSTVFTESKQGLLNMSIQKILCLLLIPFSLLLITILAALNITTVYEVPLVLPLANTLFLGIIPIVIASITFKVFKKNGSASVLLIGSGILIFGLGSIAAGWLNPLPGGPNITVTIHNTCACIGSILILAGAVMSHTSTKSGRAIRSTGIIAATYAAIVVFVTIFSLATLQGMIPPFFVPGSGPTVLRQVILENATAFFALSSVLLMVEYRKRRTDFFFWYSIALGLIAIGLLAVFFQPSIGSLIGWGGRSAQYFGFVFALYGMLVTQKAATAKGVPLEYVIASFFVDAEQSYKQLVETATDAIITFDEDYRILLWNSAAERMFGYPRDEVFGLSFLKLVIDDPYIAVVKNAERDISGRDMPALTTVPVEIVCKRKDGALFPVELTVSRRWQEGILIQTCILRDITERKVMESDIQSLNRDLEQRVIERTSQLNASLEDKVVLLREVHHRVKNNLQIIISLLNLQSRYIDDEKTGQAIKESQNRVRAMALVHEKLYQSTDIATIDLNNYIRYLGNSLFQFYGMSGKGIVLNTRIQDINVDINTAIPIGLIINELVSNSLKHAFPDGKKGEISIAIQRENAMLTILFADTGIGIPADLDWRNAESLGLRLVIMLVEQQDGTIELDRRSGTSFTIVVKETE